MTFRTLLALSSAALLSFSAVALAEDVTKIEISGIEKDLDLGQITFPSGHVMHANYGIGSAAYHRAGDEDGVFYTATDRGPNIKCKDAEKTIKRTLQEACAGKKSAKIFPLPSFSPTILTLKLVGNKVELLEKLELKDRDGNPISGLSNPLEMTNTEGAFGPDGSNLGFDPEGLDIEGLVRLKDGTFWAAEEYGPSILHIAADGKIITRFVPAGQEVDLQEAQYDIKGTLPTILAKRKLNRGAESMAVSPDEKFVYFSMQSPLANPDSKAYSSSRNVRLLKIDAATGEPVAEYVYEMNMPDTFAADTSKKKRKQSDVKVSELTAVGEDRLIVLERISKTTKFFLIDLSDGATNILGSDWDKVETSPSLSQASLADAKIQPLGKELMLDADGGDYPSKVEGIALFGDNDLVLVNDNDFGIVGAPTEVVRVKLDKAWK